MVAQAVGLDHQSKVGPVEVDFEAVDHLLGERERKPGLHRDRPEENLEVGVGEAEGALVQQAGKAAALLVPRRGFRVLPQSFRVDEVPLVRLVDGPLDLALG